MIYRKEIDGLRAIAVVPVILFHAGFDYFGGGFVGVDVFFVISGYLITTIILSEKEKGTFSLLNFYERRSRRIIPALFLVMLASSIVSWFWLSPSHMAEFSKSLVAVSIFSSNILFWTESGYWGVENELKPLLHTWSLAVEEQYYVLFPLFLMLMWRFRKRWIFGSFVLVALASLSLSHWAAYNKPTANFFLLATRGWELAIGAGIAFYFLYRKPLMRSMLSHRAVGELLSWLGLGLIAYSVFFYNESTPFPSLYALVPTIGAALIIIFSYKDSLSAKLLGSRFLVGIGLISYSAYLWHQPLFAFARHGSLQEPSPVLFGVLSLLSLLLAFVSWKYVESPFRKNTLFSANQIFMFTLVGSMLFILFGIAGYHTDGFKYRMDTKLAQIIDAARKNSFSEELCENNVEGEANGGDHCVLVPGEKEFVFLYGDSHAQALMYEAKEAFKNTEYGLLFAATPACPPVKDLYRADNSDQKACYEWNNEVYEHIVSNPKIKYVVLAARWTLGMEGIRFDNGEGGVERGRKPQLDIVKNGEYLLHEDYSHRELLADAYVNSVQYLLLSGKKVVLIFPVPEAGWNVPDFINRAYWANPDKAFDTATASTSYDVFRERNRRAVEALERIESNDNLIQIYPEEVFCDKDLPGRCITQKNEIIYYRDDDHLSDAGAKLILDEVLNSLR